MATQFQLSIKTASAVHLMGWTDLPESFDRLSEEDQTRTLNEVIKQMLDPTHTLAVDGHEPGALRYINPRSIEWVDVELRREEPPRT